MSASALLKFSQGLNVGADGEALLGVTNENVVLHNVDNAGVKSWQIDLVAADAGSTLTPIDGYAWSDSNSTPTATFDPDWSGSYRWVLKVWDVINRVGDPTDVDIRVFSIPELNGSIVPPSQVYPSPLPDPRTGLAGAKPNELNFSGQLDGWAGNGWGDGLLSGIVRQLDAGILYRFEAHTTDATPSLLCIFDTARLRPCYIRAVFDVVVDNADGSNYGYFNRTSLFRLNSARVLTHLATGDAMYSRVVPAPADGASPMSFPHVVAVELQDGHYISLVGTAAGTTTPQLDLLWLSSVQFFITQRN